MSRLYDSKMHQKLLIELGLEKKNQKHFDTIKTIEAFYRIREGLNRFDYGKILGVDYGGSSGLDTSEYNYAAYAILKFFEQNSKARIVLTKSKLQQKLLSMHKKYFDFLGDAVRCSLITEHIFNELFKMGIFKLSRKSYCFNYYYKKMHVYGWPS